jgi:2-polyprenyl-3-methyl-5-hydroxy-6-metoxy-1,4-benzoquinol methylase
MNVEVKGVKEFYDATAHDWADKWYSNETILPLLQKFINLFNNKPRVLDAGCGAGYESMRLSNLGADVVGIDISEESIRIACSKNPTCHFEVFDCKQIDASIGYFNGIVAIALLVHIEDSDLHIVFDNFKKVLKPNGFLFIAFVEGDGFSEKRSYVEVNGEKYNRAFYLHQISRMNELANNSGFKYFNEWFLSESISQWKYLVYQSE